MKGAWLSLLLCLSHAVVATAAPPGSRWGADYFPNIELVTQDGKKVRFYDLIRGKVVAINFFFTHCKAMCPAETANLRKVEKILGDQIGKDVFFYSISIDPKWDNPKALKEYAQKFGAGPHWTFLAGKEADVTLLRKKLGLYSTAPGAEQLSNHSASLLVGNENTGQWIKRSAFDHPKVLARLLGSSLQASPTMHLDGANYANAPNVPRLTRGEDVFRSRCVSCHSMGSEEGIGPSLSGITRKRSREWLSTWLKNPDKMLESGDPVATALFAKYNRVQMPNLQLTDVDVEELIRFLSR